MVHKLIATLLKLRKPNITGSFIKICFHINAHNIIRILIKL